MRTYTRQRKNLVGLYLSEEEHNFLCRTAKAYGMTKTEVIRRLCFRENEQSNFQRNDNWSVSRK